MNSVAPIATGSVAKIISGGQTGADRAALDWALANNVPHGGWCPRGRRAEDGRIADRYELLETPGTQYTQRTEWNVRDSDATVIFTTDPRLRGGAKKTMEFAHDYRRPWLHLHKSVPIEESIDRLQEFLREHQVSVLNVAGSRSSMDPAVGDFVRTVLSGLRLPSQIERARRAESIQPGNVG